MLFLRELKKIIFSIPYILFVVILIASLYSQDVLDYGNDKLEEPQIGHDFGMQNKEIPDIIMPAALTSLYQEFSANNYVTYPIGFYKNVKLNDKKREKIAEILTYLTGLNKDELLHSSTQYKGSENENYDFQINGDASMKKNDDGSFSISLPDKTTEKNTDTNDLGVTLRNNILYDDFKTYMDKADKILGGGSFYAADALIGFGKVPITFDEATKWYNLIKENDKFTGSYARLFSDYAVAMVLSILPVFLAVVLCLKDKRSKMAEIIYAKKTSSLQIVLSRYIAVVVSVMIPIVLLSYISNISTWNLYNGMQLDYFAPLKYDFGWILPTVMVVSALGMCLTELTNTPIAVAVQGLWWFLDLNTGYKTVANSYSLLRLSPRHNADSMSYFKIQDYMDNFNKLVVNRLMFIGLAIALVIITILIYEAKRRGRLNGSSKIKNTIADIKNRKNKLAA